MKINGYDFLIGADPEFFVSQKGSPVSAYGLVPGTKDTPYPVGRGAVQVDGMALEFNINPAETYAAFEENMTSVLDSITKMVPGYEVFVTHHPALGPIMNPVAEFGGHYIESQPDVAKELGCNPDFNAYTRKANPTPNAKLDFRTASGHVHIGWTEGVDPNDPTHLEACFSLVKHLDVRLGIVSMIWDQDTKRRQLYGRAGAFRPKSYGLEYRVLSNTWVNNPLLRKTVYWNTIEAIKACFEDSEKYDNGTILGKDIQSILNFESENPKEDASNIIRYANLRTPKWYRENPI